MGETFLELIYVGFYYLRKLNQVYISSTDVQLFLKKLFSHVLNSKVQRGYKHRQSKMRWIIFDFSKYFKISLLNNNSGTIMYQF